MGKSRELEAPPWAQIKESEIRGPASLITSLHSRQSKRDSNLSGARLGSTGNKRQPGWVEDPVDVPALETSNAKVLSRVWRAASAAAKIQ